MKTCRKCGHTKDESAFYPLRKVCKECILKGAKQSRASDPEKLIERSKKWRKQNHTRYIEHQRKHQKTFRDTIKDKPDQHDKYKEMRRMINKMGRDNISSWYIRSLLSKQGFPRDLITNELIELERAFIIQQRKIKSYDKKSK